MRPVTGCNETSGRWDEGISSGTEVTTDVTYYSRFHELNQYDLVIRVVNGTVDKVNDEACGKTEYSVYKVESDTNFTTCSVSPTEGYELERVLWDGQLLDLQPDKFPSNLTLSSSTGEISGKLTHNKHRYLQRTSGEYTFETQDMRSLNYTLVDGVVDTNSL